MKKLSELFNQYGSDKDRNGYTPVYQSLFEGRRRDSIKLLEIGIGTMLPGEASSMVGYALDGYEPGGSLRAWRDYFPKGEIHGMDVQPDTQFEDDRIKTFLCDSTKKYEDGWIEESFDKYDFIIDDGLHTPDAQYKTFNNFYRLLKPGGVYVIEDIIPGSTIFTEYYPFIKAIASDGISYGATVQNPDNSWKVPIMIISKQS